MNDLVDDFEATGIGATWMASVAKGLSKPSGYSNHKIAECPERLFLSFVRFVRFEQCRWL
jgi:hypothetical protein